MDLLERIWELLQAFFGGILGSFERAMTSLFGSSNARYIKKLQAQVEAIGALEPKYEAMSDDELREQTVKFRERLRKGETLDDILVEAFAVCREGGKRFLGMRHYDVQLIGGMVLHSGAIAEMVTGEGKTLVATLPAYLNGISGKGVHVITVNDYLARRDMEWMAPLYMGLGLTVAAIQSDMQGSEGTRRRQAAYACDITYGTNNEFGFDYLRDNMRPAARSDDDYPKEMQQSQGPLNYAIIDEVDNILIDEARTPLIISGPAHDNLRKYADADRVARQLVKNDHFEVNEKDHNVSLTDAGVRAAEKLAGVESFYTAGNMEWPHLIDNSLKAHYLYKKDVNYVIKDGGIVIVDEFTGRLMEGRQWSDGLHQAVEAKEGVRIKEETQTLATVTLQNFFKLYDKLSGMTGTAMTEANEFWKIYELDVVAIPTNRVLQRIAYPDRIYKTEQEKYDAIAREIERIHKWDVLVRKDSEEWGTIVSETDDEVVFQNSESKSKTTVPKKSLASIDRKGRPVLVGTTSIEKSEKLSKLLDRRGIKHEVLNAKQHKREAEIVAQAGRIGAVTIATNMAGRGTDIILGGNPETMAWAVLQDKYETRLDVPQDEWDQLVQEIDEREGMSEMGKVVKDIGGLHVIGTERHEARRIDLQLRGRCGRQGDPGGSQFYLSLNDDLMRIFAGPWVEKILDSLGMPEGEPIESNMVTRRIEAAQKKVEERNFDIRKSLLEYDEVMDEQRKRVYSYRQAILDGQPCKDLILEMIDDVVETNLQTILDKDYGQASFAAWASNELSCEFEPRDIRGMDFNSASEFVRDEAERQAESQILDAIEETLPSDEEPGEWNWGALASFANTRYGTSLRDRDLKKSGREMVDELLVEKAREAIQKADLQEGARFLESDFRVKMACAWVKHKFGFDIEPSSMLDADISDFVEIVRNQAISKYEEKESEFAVMAGMTRFGAGGQRVNREELIDWAQSRFETEVSLDDIKNKQRDEIEQLLIEHSRDHRAKAENKEKEVLSKVDSLFGDATDKTLAQVIGSNGAISNLAQWLEETLSVSYEKDDLAHLDRQQLERKLLGAVDDHYRPEMRKMERSLVLHIVDSAWKDHLLAMDHLRSSVSLVGYAQVDPKVEYKREGMKLFESMWESISQRATDLVFRMDLLDENFVGSTFKETRAVHEQGPTATDLAQKQNEAANRGTGEETAVETIRNVGTKVGRNDPCPCGSGRKYKSCCMRKAV